MAIMNHHRPLFAAALVLSFAVSALAQPPRADENPADHLPSHITRLTSFGERADWSHDGKRILFLSKTFGDAMEIDLATKQIRNLTAHYPHYGYTRALYLSNGDILLSGPPEFDPQRAGAARRNCYLYVLDKSITKRPVALGVRCSEGPAVSRKRLHIAWADILDQPPINDRNRSHIQVADIVYEDGTPKVANTRVVLESNTLPFRCTLEPQNFRPPDERELTFSAYHADAGGCDVASINLDTKKVTKHTDTANEYDEPEGIYPDGQFTLVESDRQKGDGSTHVDIWRLALDGSGQYERLTFFSDYPGYKSSNPVVSDDGRFIAFQLAKSTDAAGVGHGLFVYDIGKASAGQQ